MHSFTSCLFHCVFSTKRREPWLTSEIRERLWPYLGGIARENEMKALAIGGVADHVHVLVSLPATLPVSKAMQLLKGNSSKWMHETFPALHAFSWQEGYGAFSIAVSGVEETVAYIRSQEEHHRTRTLREEMQIFLERHGIAFEEKMLP
ncbi:MAG: IS200/IS605 family transposase [Verrucomicrobiota bacterium]|nr:IS200/IS605 family transposase [Verrucomicrobiota bacterium]